MGADFVVEREAIRGKRGMGCQGERDGEEKSCGCGFTMVDFSTSFQS